MKIHEQKGIALVNTMLVVAIAGTLMAVASQVANSHLRSRELLRKQSIRNNIANSVQTSLLTPSVLYASAAAGKNLSVGNNQLFHCVGLQAQGPAAVTAEQCQPKGGSSPGESSGYSFLLLKDGKDCQADPSQVSCWIAGQTGDGARVGYSFKGEVGRLSKDFPLEARVFFKPECPKPKNLVTIADLLQPCDYAENIKVSFQIIHRRFTANGNSNNSNNGNDRLNAYPKKPTYQSVSRFRITGEKCNEGAHVTGYDRNSGSILCECRAPFRNSGRRNQRGPICETKEAVCPSGTISKKVNTDGTYLCVPLSSSVGTWTVPVCFSTNDSLCAGREKADCRNKGGEYVGGFISRIDSKCSSQVGLKSVPTKEDASLITKIAGGAIAGGVAAIALYALGGPLGVAILIGAAIGYFFSSLFGDEDWHIPKGEVTINCEWEVTCQPYSSF